MVYVKKTYSTFFGFTKKVSLIATIFFGFVVLFLSLSPIRVSKLFIGQDDSLTNTAHADFYGSTSGDACAGGADSGGSSSDSGGSGCDSSGGGGCCGGP